VVRARDDLVHARVAAHNQLEACLDAFWPGAKVVFADVSSEIALAFLDRYPTPGSAKSLGEKRMAAFSPSTATPGGAPPPSCWFAWATHLGASMQVRRPKPAGMR